MQTEIRVPSDVNPVDRIIEIKDQQIAELVEHYEKKKSPYTKWTQQNNDDEAQEARYWLMKKSPIAYCVMDFLASNMDRYNAVICSYRVMQEKFGYSRAALSEAIKLLREHNYIDVKKTAPAISTCSIKGCIGTRGALITPMPNLARTSLFRRQNKINKLRKKSDFKSKRDKKS